MPMLQDTRLERGTSLVGIYADVTDKREKKKKKKKKEGGVCWIIT